MAIFTVSFVAIVVSNLLSYLFEILFSPPFQWSDLVVATSASAIASLLTSYFLFSQAFSIYRLSEELRREIEARKATEAELTVMNRQLAEATESALRAKQAAESANQAKSIFLANMSHELRTPLNAILGFTQILAHSQRTADEQENLNIIQRSGEHLLTLINQVLDLSKIEAGYMTLQETDIDLHCLLDDLHDMFSLKAESKQLNVIFTRGDDVPRYIRSDETKLRQVLINLLNNAIKFTPKGTIQLSVTSDRLSEDNKQSSQQLSGRPQVLSLQFAVQDTGPGIAREELDGLFIAFKQTESGRHTREGTGLGLSISKQFVRLMGGDISVKSELGQGTTLIFDIQTKPVAQIQTEAQAPANTRRILGLAPGQPRYRILIVDEHPENRLVLMKLLGPFSSPSSEASEGFELREAANGREALEVWEQFAPHLIWMDVRMPIMDGYEVTQKIRHAETRREVSAIHQVRNTPTPTRIIITTASEFEEERETTLSKGCDDFLRKPFRETDVFEILHKQLGIHFVYDESDGKIEEKRSFQGKKLKSIDLIVLSEDIREQLTVAATLCDLERTSELIDTVGLQHPDISDKLKALAENYEYSQILSLLREDGEETP